MMRALTLIAFFVIQVQVGLYSSFRLTADDGWSAVIELNDPDALKKPLIFLFIRKNETNSFFFMDSRKLYEVKLDMEDGAYDYILMDGGKTALEKGGFILKTPFQAAFKKVGPDRVELEIGPDGNRQLKYALELSNRRIVQGTTNIGATTRLKLENLEPSSLYTLTLGVDAFKRKIVFITGPENVALNKPVFGTFNRLPVSRFIDDSTPALSRINDGKREWLSGMAVSGEVDSDEQFAYINLEKVCRLKSVSVVWHADYYPLKYYFVYGNDGKNWNVIRRDAGLFVPGAERDNTPVRVDVIRTNVEARTIGIVIKKGDKIRTRIASRNFVELLEIEAYE